MAKKSKILEGMSNFAERIAEVVFAPDYYEGPWYAYYGDTRRKCSNYTTAMAWCRYLRRHYIPYLCQVGKVFDKEGADADQA
jgi:hypothetical protein